MQARTTSAWLALLWFITCWPAVAGAKSLARSDVPAPLAPWVDWVLHDEHDFRCPFFYADHRQRRCAWPTRLRLELDERRGQFVQSWLVHGKSWIMLPGDPERWPQNVRVNGELAVVVARDKRPSIELTPGNYEVGGEFRWDRLPESLVIPADTALLALSVKGKPVAFPDFEAGGRLWLRERDTGARNGDVEGDRIELQVFRRVVDEIPLMLVTRINLFVSGSQRELLLNGSLPKDFIPLSLTSPLPVRLEADGRLRLQVRPGNWRVELSARAPGELTSVGRPQSQAPWPDTEVWVFDARNHLRLVEVQGVTTLDPRQTTLPGDWMSLPAYRLDATSTMNFRVVRRGDPTPEPDKLRLERTLWLDFDGGGYSQRDKITGTMTRGWRMSMRQPVKLGRVVIDDQPQFITRLPGVAEEGVEVRRGALDLEADSRVDTAARQLPVAGWQQDFQQVRTTLYLPPGWRLLSAPGVDYVPGTWLQRWTLLDLFVVLIAALAVMRLWGWAWGFFALITLALIWHEPGAPRYVWLNIIAAVALLRVLPEGWFQRAARWYRNASLLALVLLAIPFMIDQVRTGLYPQLRHDRVAAPTAPGTAQDVREEKKVAPARSASERAKQESLRSAGLAAEAPASQPVGGYVVDKIGRVSLSEFDPKASIQTGPGLPRWSWSAQTLVWSGPVPRDQQFRLLLLSPAMNLVLNFLRALLIAILALAMVGLRYTRGNGFHLATALVLPALLIAALLSSWPQAARAEFPPAEMLDTLKQRLIAAPDCLPDCARIPRMRILVTPAQLDLRLEVHAAAHVAVPLPGHAKQWLAREVLVDGRPASALAWQQGAALWLALPPGRHQVSLSAPMPARNNVELPLPLKPDQVQVIAEGWTVEGVHENGVSDPQLNLTRIRAGAQTVLPELEATTFPAFVRVERTLRLGLDWRVDTQVQRVSPLGAIAVLEVPLLPGESVTTAGVRVENGKVLVNMAPNQNQMAWQSLLEKTERIALAAPATTKWTEVWRLDAGPVWHVALAGIPVIHHQDPNGRWLPEWRPWPGESVSMNITRPQGVEGRTLTVDHTRLVVRPGQRATDAELALELRSSRGGQHTITLPTGASLQSVLIAGSAQPIRQDGDTVTLPIVPGQQQITLSWRSAEGIHSRFMTPKIDLGVDSVNSDVHVQLSRDRWVLLTGGPRLGPAVLFWGVLIVLALIAAGLGRVPLTPLKTWQWFLLGVGLSQTSVWMGVIVVGWLLALGARARAQPDMEPRRFQVMQVGLAVVTVVALSLLVVAIQHGLLGLPEMQIAGNGSNAYRLNWYQDRAGNILPQAWVWSVPLSIYRWLMLAWALWLAFALLSWLRWGWDCIATHGLWRKVERTAQQRSWGRRADKGRGKGKDRNKKKGALPDAT